MPEPELICGIDEVGRGPLAGPVVAACVIIPGDVRGLPFWSLVTDSKKLTAKKREYLFPLIRQHCRYGIAEASVQEIDDLNIHHATLLAMKRSYFNCCHPERSEGSFTAFDFRSFANVQDDRMKALIDGKFCPTLPCAAQAIVGGDGKVPEISAASILAKVTRDHLMMKLHKEYPYFGWDRNAGYGTAQHMEGLAQHGPTDHHRQSFAPIRLYAKTG